MGNGCGTVRVLRRSRHCSQSSGTPAVAPIACRRLASAWRLSFALNPRSLGPWTLLPSRVLGDPMTLGAAADAEDAAVLAVWTTWSARQSSRLSDASNLSSLSMMSKAVVAPSPAPDSTELMQRCPGHAAEAECAANCPCFVPHALRAGKCKAPVSVAIGRVSRQGGVMEGDWGGNDRRTASRRHRAACCSGSDRRRIVVPASYSARRCGRSWPDGRYQP